jgi:hypothetical protein
MEEIRCYFGEVKMRIPRPFLISFLCLFPACSSSSESTDGGKVDRQPPKDMPVPIVDAAVDRTLEKDTSLDLKNDLLKADANKPESMLLLNASDQCDAKLLVPSKDEEGHLCAGRLTPPAYPFIVWDIRYHLGHGPTSIPAVGVDGGISSDGSPSVSDGGKKEKTITCNATLAHEVQLYISKDVKPPSTPSPAAILAIPADTSGKNYADGRFIIQKLDSTLTLNQGEHLFIAIKFAGAYPDDVLCVAVNEDDPYEGNRNYWSNAAAPPYSWTQLDTFGLMGSILVSAGGYVPN